MPRPRIKQFDERYICQEYVQNKRSTSDIAKELKTYPITIRRILKRNNVTVRSHSDAQKQYLKNNVHPMQGKTRTAAEREKISDGMRKFWDNMTPEEKEKDFLRRSQTSKKMWAKMTTQEKELLLGNMRKANLKTRNQGSRNENMIAELLKDKGYVVSQRTNDYTPGHMFEIDICLPNDSIAIEVDGITHYDGIYGDKQFKRVCKSDKNKNQILLNAGFMVIRVKDMSSKHSRTVCTRATDQIISLISNPKKAGKIHYIDMK